MSLSKLAAALEQSGKPYIDESYLEFLKHSRRRSKKHCTRKAKALAAILKMRKESNDD